MGIETPSDIQFYIVENYPKPYSHLKGTALSPDESDEIKYNIKKGIYFRKDKLLPVQSSLTLAHEMVHCVIGEKGSHLLARGIEEGICEFIGSFYCGYRLFKSDVILNQFIYKRLKYNHNSQKFKLYMSYFRSAYLLYTKLGLNGLVHLINSGREEIKKAEVLIANNELYKLNIPIKPIYDDNFTTLASYIALGFPEEEVIGPLSYWLSQNLLNIKDAKQVIIDLNIDLENGKEALEELESRLFAILLDNYKIEYSDVETLLLSKSYRYEI